MASQLGTNEREIIIGLTADNELFVHCATCTPEELSEAAAAGFEKKLIVLDLSAIITISRLRAWDILDRDKEYLVSRGTYDRIAEWLQSTETGSQPAGYSFLRDDGSIGFQSVTPEQLSNDRAEIQAIVAEVGARCTVKSSITLANLDPKRRGQYIGMCGLHSLESASLAGEENALLWTDDLFVAMLGDAEFGVRRIWTQLAFKVLEYATDCEHNLQRDHGEAGSMELQCDNMETRRRDFCRESLRVGCRPLASETMYRAVR